MSKYSRLAVAVLVAPCIWLMAPSASGVDYNYRPTHHTFAVRGGFVYGSTLNFVEQDEISTELGLSLGILFDVPVGSKVVGGLAFDLYDIQVQDIRRKFLDISVSAKRVIFLPAPNFTLRIGGAVGFGYLGPGFGFDRSTYLTTKAMVEGVFPINIRYAWIIDLTLLHVPLGGNHEVRAKYGPTVVGRVGILM